MTLDIVQSQKASKCHALFLQAWALEEHRIRYSKGLYAFLQAESVWGHLRDIIAKKRFRKHEANKTTWYYV